MFLCSCLLAWGLVVADIPGDHSSCGLAFPLKLQKSLTALSNIIPCPWPFQAGGGNTVCCSKSLGASQSCWFTSSCSHLCNNSFLNALYSPAERTFCVLLRPCLVRSFLVQNLRFTATGTNVSRTRPGLIFTPLPSPPCSRIQNLNIKHIMITIIRATMGGFVFVFVF